MRRPYVFYIVLALAWLVSLSACSKTAAIAEVSRVASPDGVVEAVLTTTGKGATTSTVYRIFIVPAGQMPNDGAELLRADKVENMRLVWREGGFLEIYYDRARIFHFKNFWNSRAVRNFRSLVELRLLPEPDTPSLRPPWPG